MLIHFTVRDIGLCSLKYWDSGIFLKFYGPKQERNTISSKRLLFARKDALTTFFTFFAYLHNLPLWSFFNL